jgi:alkyldihydroxyacetonephosphate synthase
MAAPERRWNGWGYLGEAFVVPPAASAWLAARVPAGDRLPRVDEAEVVVPDPRPLPPLPVVAATDRATRLRHACGQSFPDLVTLRTGRPLACPDAVVEPADVAQVVAVLAAAARHRLPVVVRGGGTSVVGGVTVPPRPDPVLVVSLARLRGLVALDRSSLLATFLAGTTGPEVESALAAERLRLGHEPQSFELSTVGGWVATRSAGARSSGIGKIDDLVAGVEIATAAGPWALAPQPASAAGPELRRLVLGSEGRLGVITAATLRVRPRPAAERGTVVLLPGWEEGLACCRELAQAGTPVEVMRLSDPDETAFASALVELTPLVARAARLLFASRRFARGCALLLGWTGTEREIGRARADAGHIWRRHGGLAVGAAGWRRWLRERFRHPYLRDALLSAGWGVDTFETAAPWRRLPALHGEVRAALDRAAAACGLGLVQLCHLSHAYPDGASLYFTIVWPLRRDRELSDWRELKRAATSALLSAGGTLSHHHGVGTMHAPFLGLEIGAPGIAALRAAARALDPEGILNPGVLLVADPGLSRSDPGPRTPDPGSRSPDPAPRTPDPGHRSPGREGA